MSFLGLKYFDKRDMNAELKATQIFSTIVRKSKAYSFRVLNTFLRVVFFGRRGIKIKPT